MPRIRAAVAGGAIQAAFQLKVNLCREELAQRAKIAMRGIILLQTTTLGCK
jgi:hypothetical protein